MNFSKFQYYKVGGCVRDQILGLSVKDIDLVAIGGNFQELCDDITAQGGKIYLTKPEFFTIRCNFPEIGPCDIVLARKDGVYHDGRHPDKVELAENLRDESRRRDFTINALFQDIKTNEIIDYVGGIEDINNKIIRCVGRPRDRFDEDKLRMLRAIRFAITKKMNIDTEIKQLLNSSYVFTMSYLPTERIYGELVKMFTFDTYSTLKYLEKFPEIKVFLFSELSLGNKLWLKPSLEER